MDPMFDFSQFTGGDSKRAIEFLGLSETETKALLSDRYGLSMALMDRYGDVTKRGTQPNAVTKCLIVWEHNSRNCSYAEIADGCDISLDTAYQQMAKARKWVLNGFGLVVEHHKDRIYLVTNETLGQKVERLDKALKPVEKRIKACVADLQSITRQGDTPILAGSIGKLVTAYASMEGVDLQTPALGAAPQPATTQF